MLEVSGIKIELDYVHFPRNKICIVADQVYTLANGRIEFIVRRIDGKS